MAETAFRLRRVETRLGPLALVTIDDGEEHTRPTTLGRAALESLAATLGELESGEWVAMVLTGKPFVFCAGADIDEFPRVETAAQAAEGSRAGHELFGRIRALPYPTLAAVNGACLGGGLELALHCDARTISTAVRHVACPEVFLGLFPAWGGTQLLPRLVGPAAAVRLVVSNPLRQNRMLTGPEAAELGLADRLLEPAEFLDDSIAAALELVERPLARPEADMSETADVVRRARAQVDDAVHGAAPAPYAALDLIEGAASWPLEEGYRREEQAIGELLPGPQAQASIYAYGLVERRARRGVGVPKVETRPVRSVGIVGAGLMATQLATLFLRRLELPIVLRDVEQEIVDRALAAIGGELAGQVARGRYDEGKARFLGSLVSGSTSYEGFAGCDLVLEAVFEELAVKREVLAELEAVVRPDCVLATNTSSLSVSAMAAGLAHPGRVVGMHFFNPVAVMPLLELVRAAETDDATLATAWETATRLRKRSVVVRNAPGFVVNRLLTRMLSVVLAALEAGTAVETADEAILSLGLPMAPSVLLQMVGPRVAHHTLETMHAAFPERFPLSPTLRNYAEGRDEIVVAQERPQTAGEIRTEALEALADEARRLLEEGVVAEAADIDTALLLGAGFPFFMGGLTRHLDQTGVSQRLFGHPLAGVGATGAG